MGAICILKRYAKARENSLRIAGALTGSRASAITKIKKIADFFSQKNESVQLRAVLQCESEILTLLPHPESRFSKLRNQMLDLIENAKNQNL
jgi:hypothetical protein